MSSSNIKKSLFWSDFLFIFICPTFLFLISKLQRFYGQFILVFKFCYCIHFRNHLTTTLCLGSDGDVDCTAQLRAPELGHRGHEADVRVHRVLHNYARIRQFQVKFLSENSFSLFDLILRTFTYNAFWDPNFQIRICILKLRVQNKFSFS